MDNKSTYDMTRTDAINLAIKAAKDADKALQWALKCRQAAQSEMLDLLSSHCETAERVASLWLKVADALPEDPQGRES